MGAQGPSSDDSGVGSIGKVLAGRYKIESVLGTGGMGRVYRCAHPELGRSVAIKVLHSSLGCNPEAATRFQREAVASGRLDHPNIVRVLDFGVLDNGSLFLVMEALEGEHLGRRLARENQMLWFEALTIVRSVLLGLRHAHDRGVVHRDIKPDNIFLANKEGEEVVKILDFGIAKLYAGASEDLAATRAGITVGTPTYLAPEQAIGGAITPACDLYSTSVMLYEMLVGRAPFEDDNPINLLAAHTCSEVPAFDDVAPTLELPPGLEALVRHGLEKIAVERISSASEYVQRIDEILIANGVEVATMPVSVRGSQSMGIPIGPYARLTPAPGHLGRTPVPGALSPSPDFLAASLVFGVPVAAARAPAAPIRMAAPIATEPVAPTSRPKIARTWLVLGGAAIAVVIACAVALFVRGPRDSIATPTTPAIIAAPRVPSPRPVVDDHQARLSAALRGLQQGKTCAARKAVIPTLVELEDSSALPALKRARNRGANACLRVAASEAIKKLGATTAKKL